LNNTVFEVNRAGIRDIYLVSSAKSTGLDLLIIMFGKSYIEETIKVPESIPGEHHY
jgi:hypothetical protein